MQKAFKYLDKIIEVAEAILGCTMIVCLVIEVLGRYILPFSTTWTEELARYCLVWAMMLGCGYGFGKNYHIVIDILTHKLSGKAKYTCDLLSNIFTIAFCLIVFWLSIERFPYVAKEYMTMVRVSFGYVYAALPTGLALAVLYCLKNIIDSPLLKRGDSV